MARNAERANAVLNKWLAVKDAVSKSDDTRAGRRGFGDANECTSVEECTKVRGQLLREIGRGISLIQDASLGEHRIRDLNDEINRKIKAKRRWEHRIRELGGPDYLSSSDSHALSGISVGGGDYFYFGAAKELPGVRELFSTRADEVNIPRKTRAQLFKSIKPDYFGWKDEDDDNLVLAEQNYEAEWISKRQAEADIKKSKLNKILRAAADSADVAAEASGDPHIANVSKRQKTTSDTPSNRFKVYVDLPTEKEIKKLILNRRKQLLMEKYASPASQKEQEESRSLVARQE